MNNEGSIITPNAFYKLFINGWIVDGRNGGLIRGRLHNEGHILLIEPTDKLAEFRFIGVAEGNEYIMNSLATEKHFERISEINSYPPAELTPINQKITENTRIINTQAEPHDKLLIVHRQFIINRKSTAHYFEELEKLNAEFDFYHGIGLPDKLTEELKQIKI